VKTVAEMNGALLELKFTFEPDAEDGE